MKWDWEEFENQLAFLPLPRLPKEVLSDDDPSVSALKDSATNDDGKLLPLWVADMDFEASPAVISALKNRLDQSSIFGYNLKPKSYFEAIQNWMHTQHNFKVEKDWITTVSGTLTSVNMTVMAFTQPTDKIIVHSPVYHPLIDAAVWNGRQIVKNVLVHNPQTKRYEIDFISLEKLLSDPLVKMMILCNPHNPVGRAWTRDELEKIASLCDKHDVLIVSDEQWGDFTLFGHKFTPIASVSPNAITVFGPAKSFNLAAINSNFTIIPNKKLRDNFNNFHQRLGFFNGNVMSDIALEACYTQSLDWLTQVRKYVEGNIEYIIKFTETELNNVIQVVKPEATYLVWLDCRGLKLSQDQLKDLFLKKARIWATAGESFEVEGTGYMRLNAACSRVLIEKAMRRLKKVLNRFVDQSQSKPIVDTEEHQFQGKPSIEILKYWEVNPPPESELFPPSSTTSSFDPSTHGFGSWRHKGFADDNWEEYPPYVNAVLEYNYRRGVKAIKINMDGGEYLINLEIRTHKRVGDTSKTRLVMRETAQ